MGVAPPTSKRVQQGLDATLPDVDDADMSGVFAVEESDEGEDEAMPSEEIRIRCNRLRPAVGGSRGSGDNPTGKKQGQEDHVVDLMTDDILRSSSVAEAAF